MPSAASPPNTQPHGNEPDPLSRTLATVGTVVSVSLLNDTLVEEEAVRVLRELCCVCC